MPALCLSTRAHLCMEMERRVLDQPRMPDGSRAMILTPCDLKLYKVLALDRANGLTGRCDPGYRRLATDAGISRGTVGNSTRRLQAAGWIGWKRKLHYVHGVLRFGRAYFLAPKPPELRPRFGPKPIEIVKRLGRRAVDKAEPANPVRSAAAQIAAIKEWLKETEALQEAPQGTGKLNGAFGVLPRVTARAGQSKIGWPIASPTG